MVSNPTIKPSNLLHAAVRLPATACAASLLFLLAPPALADHGSPRWGPQTFVIAGAGCPIETPDGLSLMVASGRAGGMGGNDIWVIDRAAVGAQWSEPKNLPMPINSTKADFCPAPVARSLYFVSNRSDPTRGIPCGGDADGGDIYFSRQSPAGDWSEPVHLPCAADGGPNTPGTERSPSFIKTWYGTFLFFSTNGGVAGAKEDIFVSILRDDGQFGHGQLVAALSTPDEDQMPTVRQINGKFEITFNSNRPGAINGSQDAYHARAAILPFWWSKPVNAGPNVNTSANETRASLSSDGRRLYVGRGDVFVSERQ